jgi:hypothetical protein
VRRALKRTMVAGSVAVMLAVAITGCSGSPTRTTPTASESGTPSTSPSAPASAAPKDVLFTISANVRDKNGSTVAIQLTAHAPILSSASGAKPLLTEFLAECGGGVAGNPVDASTLVKGGSILMSIDLASSAVGKSFAYPLDLATGSQNFAQSAKGTGITEGDSTSPCYGVPSHRWATSGNAHAVADFESGTSTPDFGAWRYGQFGFSVPFDSNTTIEACTVTLTPLATAANVSAVVGWDPNSAATGTACLIGHVGE